ncbi:MFS transporter [Sutterella massiliensis]|uniref:MFS transporter n=1 Tax=Sutterella massiliensis TaxID=1816689 RepID=A0ABS2DU73_9BURK|nr:MFS transporter [Sutterella massiliensis]MBM6704839.1 MFS transporter [Sutterella massiliensis]
MSFHSLLKRKPKSAAATLDLPLSASDSLHREKTDEKIHAVSRTPTSAVSGAELWAARIGFFAGGFTVASWAPLIPFVQSQLALEPYVLGFLLLGLGVGSFVGMPLAGKLTEHLGARNAILLSGLASCFLLVVLSLVPSLYVECAALLAYGVTLGCLEVSVNIYGTHLENRNKSRLMSGLHAAYSVGEVVSAAALTALFVLGLAPSQAVSTLMVLLALTMVALLRRIENHPIEAPEKPKDRRGAPALSGPVSVLAAVCAVIFLTEGSMLDWSAIYLRDFADVPQEMSAVGYTLFVIAMAFSRLMGDKLAMKFGAVTMLSAGICIMLATLLALVVYPQPAVALLSLFLMGLGIANIAPIVISAASRTASMDSVKAITAVTTVGYGGLLAGPALIGAVSSALSLQIAFLAVCALLAVSLILVRRHSAVFQ